ncbi:hypothetical protein FF100_04995 [Methylobacterium terricola]|uniref:Uncharacterized protein n=1 Tax=Methylobacterium terricola TaxID=2583531 RepID=A0A5C4LLV0_9HYPH|nr:hypothetical protein [Methylobacterium terricola]TNC14935.1 hypothetical protein FF100_04995 [Methylobacterium terricola]
MDQPFLYEFLYRGRPAGSAEAPAWHVILGQYVTLPGASNPQFTDSGALTPAQAEAAGYPLATVLAGIDAAALAGRDAALAEAEAARQERDAATADAAVARGERDAATADTAKARQDQEAAAAQAAEALTRITSERDAALADAAAARQDRDAAMATAAKAASEAPSRRDWAETVRQEGEARAAQSAVQVPPPALPAVSDRQFFQALAQAGTISQDEALAAVMTGVLPARIEAAVAGLPEAEQFAARMLLSGATTFDRHHPMVAQLGAALGYDDAALDALWAAAAAL